MLTGKFGYKDITYQEACTIEKHSNVKEISVIHYSGTYKNKTRPNDYQLYSYIVECDENAINNLIKNNLIEGRLPQNSNEVVVDINSSFDEIGDKLVQTIENGEAKEYTVVGILLMILFKTYNIGEMNGLSASLIIGVIYASFDEIHQCFIPGRGPQVTDIVIDSMGVLFGILLVLLIQKIYKKIILRKNSIKEYNN